MDLISLASILIRLFAMGWSVVLLRRLRDWRIATFTLMFGLMVTRQALTIAGKDYDCFFCFTLDHLSELPGLVGSVLAFLVVIAVGRLILEQQRSQEVLREQRSHLDLLQKITATANISPSSDAPLQTALLEICRHTGWPIGHVYKTPDQAQDMVEPAQLWHLEDPERFKDFRSVTEAMPFPAGGGLPGRVLATGRPTWIKDVTTEPNFPRAQAAEKINLRSGFGFPVLVDDRVVAVLEFFSTETQAPTAGLLEVMSLVGTELGRAIEREQAHAAMRTSSQQLQAIIDNTTAVVYAKDLEGRYLLANQRYEKLFKVRLADIAGKTDHALFPKEVADVVNANDRMVLESKSAIEFEEVVQHPDGELHTYISNKFPLLDARGRVYAVCGISTDITERARIESDLKRQTARFETIFQGLPDAVVLVDGDRNIVMCNGSALRIYGYSEDEVLGRNSSMFYANQEDHEAVGRDYFEPGTTDIGKPYEMLFKRKNGEVFTGETVAAIIRDTDGMIQGYLGMVRDITDRKRGEQQLRLNDFVMNYALDAVFIVDRDGRIKGANETACSRLEYTRDELTNMAIADIDPHYPKEAWPEHWEALKREKYQVFESEHRTKSGRIFPVEIATGHIKFEGVECACGFVRDITDRKRAADALQESEKRYRSLFEDNPTMYFTVQEDGTVSSVNRFGAGQLGYQPKELIGRSVLGVVHEDDQERVRRHLRECIAAEGEATLWEFRKVRKDGQIMWVRETGRSVTYDKNKPPAVLIVCEDITAHKQFELDKARLELELRQAQKMEAIGTLASGVAHDFNNLLTAIYGHVEIARAHLPNEHPALESLEMIDQASTQGSNVTRSLLTFAHKSPSTKEPIELTGLIRESVRMLHRLLPASIEMTQQVTGDSEVWVYADATQIQQVLMNLAINARDAMDGGGRLRINLRLDDDAQSETESPPGETANRGHAVLVLEDTGEGMTPETLERIYEPFFTTKPRGAGTGLGLAVVHGIITEHDGQIDVESHPGSGTRMTIRLPICDAPDKPDAQDPRARAGKTRTGRIILAEDNEFVRTIMASTLKAEGYEVICATDGEDAMNQFNATNGAADLVILDLDMPKETGQSCLARIKDQRKDMPAIVITGNVNLLLKRPPGDESTPVMTKPFQMSQLIDKVNGLLGTRV